MMNEQRFSLPFDVRRALYYDDSAVDSGVDQTQSECASAVQSKNSACRHAGRLLCDLRVHPMIRMLILLITLTNSFAQTPVQITVDSALLSSRMTPVRMPTFTEKLNNKARQLAVPRWQNAAFHVGERLTFKIYLSTTLVDWLAGYTIMEVMDTVIYQGRPCYHIRWTTRSTDFIAFFYTLKDTLESYVDMEYGMTWYYSNRKRDGGFNRDMTVRYDHLNGNAEIETIRYEDEAGRNIRKKRNYSVKIKPFTQDILSSFYYLRTQPFDDSEKINIPVHSNKLSYDLTVNIRKQKKQEVISGTYKTYPVLPQVKGEGIFNSTGETVVYFSTDRSRMPVRMTTEINLGSINAELESHRNKYYQRNQNENI